MNLLDLILGDQKNDLEHLQLFATSQLERNRLLARKNGIDIFRYIVPTDTLYYIFYDRASEKPHEVVCTQFTKRGFEAILSHEAHARIVSILQRVVAGNCKPEPGTLEFYSKDGQRRMVCDYTWMLDKEGRLYAAVGQVSDFFMQPANMLRTIERQNEYMRIVNSLQEAFETMLMVDLTNFSFKLLKASPAVMEIAHTIPGALELAEMFCKYQITPEYQDLFRQFVDVNTLSERLQGQRYLMVEYNTYNLGWVHARLIPAVTDTTGRVTHALLTTECAEQQHQENVYLRYASQTDGLTGLLNRTTGERKIRELLAEGAPGVFALFDCDYFKQINDTLSHLVGDQVLVKIARVMRESFPGQVVMRLGGDEFVIYLTGDEVSRRITSTVSVGYLFQAFYRMLKTITIAEMGDVSPSMSGGVAVNDGNSVTSFEELYRMADQALLEVKSSRKGTIKVMSARQDHLPEYF